MSNIHEELQSKDTDELLRSSTPTSLESRCILSAKRRRDPSQRKNVSFNDVPIVHEVPSHDTGRNSNSETFRSWTYTDATPSIAVLSPFSASHILSPFQSTSAAAQKLHATRLSSALYSPLNSASLTRLPDWVSRARTAIKQTEDTSEHYTNSNTSPLIIINTHDERIHKNSGMHSHTVCDNGEEKRSSYRSAIMPDPEHYQSLPFSFMPMSESTSTYTSMLSTNLNSSTNHSLKDSLPIAGQHTRLARARSATIPITAIHSSVRSHDNVSIVPIRTAVANSIPNGILASSLPSRTILKPTTIEFQCSQSTGPTTNNSATLTATNSTNTKSPTASPRINSSSNHHSRLATPANRPLSSSIKYPVIHPVLDSTIKPSSNAFPRSRSAHFLSTKRSINSPVVVLEGQSGGTNNTNTLATAKCNPNVRQTYGSHYMHRILLPANIN